MDNTEERIKQHLIDLAKESKITSYKSLVYDLNLSIGYNSKELEDVLTKISEKTYADDKILLSALVVNRTAHIPGHGFFKFQKQSDDKTIFWAQETIKVIEHYRYNRNFQ